MRTTNRWADYLYIAGTIVFTVYGQLITKWQLRGMGELPDGAADKGRFLVRVLLNPWVLSGFGAAFLAAVCWLGALAKFDLGYAYPFMAMSFVVVLFISAWTFGEPITLSKVCGVALVILGLTIGARG